MEGWRNLKPLFLFPNILIPSAKVSTIATSIGAILFYSASFIWGYLKRVKYKFYISIIIAGVASFSFPLAFVVFALFVVRRMKKAKLGGTRFAAFGFVLGLFLVPSAIFTKPLSPVSLVAASAAALLFIGGISYRFRPIHLDPVRFASPALREEVITRHGNRCLSCGADGNSPGVEIQIDHIVPWSKGGKTEINNLQPLCSRCNKAKSDH
jgi:hypothetical protein